MMSRTDRGFWFTVIPAVILWNTVRTPIVAFFSGTRRGALSADGSLHAEILTTILFGCAIALAAGYVAAVISAPQHLKAGVNVAVGVTVAFGLQTIIEDTSGPYPPWYFVAVPLLPAVAAICGGFLRGLQRKSGEPA